MSELSHSERDLRQRIAAVVREELMRWVQQARRGGPGAAAAGPSLGVLITGVGAFPDAWVTLLAALSARRPLAWLAVESRRAAILPVPRLEAALRAAGYRGPAPAVLDAADLRPADDLLVLPASLDLLGAVEAGRTASAAAALVLGALARGARVVLAGSPTRAEGWQVRAGHPLHRRAEELIDAARRLGALPARVDDLLGVLAPDQAPTHYVPPGRDRPRLLFLTERDIEDMHKRGERQLIVRPDMRLTPSARDRAAALGLELVEPR